MFQGKKNGVSFRTTLIAIFAFLIVASAGLIGYVSFYNGQAAARNLTNQTQDSIQAHIEQDLHSFLAVPHALNQVNAAAIESGLLEPRDFHGLRQQFLHQIKAFETVMTCAFGSAAGDFISAGRRSENEYDSAIADKQLDNDYRVFLLDEQGQPAEMETLVQDYQPQLRPWYQAAITANGPAWSPVYIWASQNNIGISAVRPVFDNSGAVLGVQQSALSLGHIGQFLASNTAINTEQIFVMERSGLLVASSTREPLLRQNAGGSQLERVPAAESANPLIRATAAYLHRQFPDLNRISGKQRVELEVDGINYFLSMTPFSDEYGLDWLVVVATPESDLMGPVTANTQTTFLLGLAILAATLVGGVALTRWASRPIVQLHNAMQEPGVGNWKKIEVRTPFKEMKQLTDSFNQMAGQLRDSFATLEQRIQERTGELISANEQLQAEIAERKQVEAELQENALRLSLALESANAGIWEWDLRTNKNVWSDELWAVYDLEPHSCEPSYEAWRDAIHPADRAAAEQAVQAAAQNFAEIRVVWRVATHDDSTRWVMSRGKPIFDAAGQPQRYLGVVIDITEQKQAEEALRQSEEKFSRAFLSSPVALLITRLADGKFLEVNDAYSKIVGYDRSELIGRLTTEFNIFIKSTDRAVIVEQLKATGSVRDFETSIRHRSGEIRRVVAAQEMMNFNGETCILSSLLDITARKRAEEELWASEQRLRAAIKPSNMIFAQTDLEARYTWIHNPHPDFDPAMVLGKTDIELADNEGTRALFESKRQVIASGVGIQTEIAVPVSDGPKYYEVFIEPVYGKSGQLVGVTTSSYDLTDRKQAEEELRRSNAELEQFAYVASHDLQEPLRAVAGMVQLLGQRYKGQLDERADTYINHAVEAAARMQNLINDLLDYSRVGRLGKSFEAVAVEESLAIALANLQALIAETQAQITHDPLPTLMADPGQLAHLLQNLIERWT